MKRHFTFALLLTTGVVLVNDRPEARQATPAVDAQAKSAAPRQTDDTPAKTGTAGEAQTETQKPSGAAGDAAAAQQATQPAGEPAQGKPDEAKLTSTPGSKALGISILGNQEAPTSLTIVPWKTSELGNSLGISPVLDDSRQPVDRDVFMRALRYHEISSGATGGRAAADGREKAAESDATQSSTAPRRR
jgi:hypothetical protein